MKRALLGLLATIAFAGDWPVNNPFTLGFVFSGAPPTSIIMALPCPQQLYYSANFLGTYASCGTSPGESDIYTIKVAGSTIGTITLGTSCAANSGTTGAGVTLATIGGAAQVCPPGARIELDGPATVSGANIGIALNGTR